MTASAAPMAARQADVSTYLFGTRKNIFSSNRSENPLDALLICEWDLEPKGYDPDLFQSKEDVEDLRRKVKDADRRRLN